MVATVGLLELLPLLLVTKGRRCRGRCSFERKKKRLAKVIVYRRREKHTMATLITSEEMEWQGCWATDNHVVGKVVIG